MSSTPSTFTLSKYDFDVLTESPIYIRHIENFFLQTRLKDKSEQDVFVKHYAHGGNEVQKTIFSQKIRVKVTRSSTLLSFEDASFVEFACQMHLLPLKHNSKGLSWQ